jgi:hypothetical protein
VDTVFVIHKLGARAMAALVPDEAKLFALQRAPGFGGFVAVGLLDLFARVAALTQGRRLTAFVGTDQVFADEMDKSESVMVDSSFKIPGTAGWRHFSRGPVRCPVELTSGASCIIRRVVTEHGFSAGETR